MMNEVHIPLREYLDEKDESLRRWMVEKFATKDDVGLLRLDVSALTHRDVRESRKVAATWGGAGTAIGAAVVTVLAYFGIRPQQ